MRALAASSQEQERVRRLQNRTALITGAGAGIGKSITLALAREGAGVICADLDGPAANAVAKEVESIGGRALATRTDVTRSADCQRAVEAAVSTFGTIDLLVNNAGVLLLGRALEVTEADLDRQYAVNVKGVLFMTQAVLPTMSERQQGAIVMIASLAGLRGGIGNIAYAATKHAFVGMTRCLALECAPWASAPTPSAPAWWRRRWLKARTWQRSLTPGSDIRLVAQVNPRMSLQLSSISHRTRPAGRGDFSIDWTAAQGSRPRFSNRP